MNKGLRGEFREEKENTRKILLHARMTEIRYNERFSSIIRKVSVMNLQEFEVLVQKVKSQNRSYLVWIWIVSLPWERLS